jgi:hypothetical protein
MNTLSTYIARPRVLISSTCVKISSRLAQNYGNQQYPAVIVPFTGRCFSAAKSSKKGKQGDDQGDDPTAAPLSYFERKSALKQQRIQYYQHKLQRTLRCKHRRDSAPKDVLKNEFKSWWDRRRIYEEMMDRKSRQVGMEWKIQVATIVERLPVVLPDKMKFETDFEDLQAYLKYHTGKIYPVEFTGTGGSNRPVAFTDEELIGRWKTIKKIDHLPISESITC